MIYICTGLPGAAKTLFAINRILTDNQLKDRAVYYHGIDDLRLPWYKFDPKKWEECPDGSVIVIDEAWKIFPLRPSGSLVPKYIEGLTEHRHRGFDFVLITQDATLIDAFVRKLAERHFHLKRPFGLDYAVVHEFHGVSDPNNGAAIKQSIQSRFKHPKHLYGIYKSATIHAVKKRVPLKVLILPICFVVLAFIANTIYQKMYANKLKEKEVASGPGKGAQTTQTTQTAVSGSEGSIGLPRDFPGYVDTFTPRSRDMPASAPVFDKLVTEVKDFPRIAACVQSSRKCWCYTQQGTRLDIRVDICQAVVRVGNSFDPYKQSAGGLLMSASNAAAVKSPVPVQTPSVEGSSSSNIAVFE